MTSSTEEKTKGELMKAKEQISSLIKEKKRLEKVLIDYLKCNFYFEVENQRIRNRRDRQNERNERRNSNINSSGQCLQLGGG